MSHAPSDLLHYGLEGGDSLIELTRFDGSRFFVNADYIEFIETTPDTIVSLIDHKKLLVRESAQEVLARIFAYRQRLDGQTSSARRPTVQWNLHQQHKAEHENDQSAMTEEGER